MRNTGLKIILLSLICLLLVFSINCSKTQKLKIIQVKKTEIPVVNFRVMVFSGSADDPKGKEGLAYFASSMLKKGTQSYSREQLEELLDFLSARIDVSVDKQVIVVSGTTLKGKSRQILSAFHRGSFETLFSSGGDRKTEKRTGGRCQYASAG